MRIAFYAPLKAPDHPVPSGDRQIARSLLGALAAGGHDVSLAARFRSFDARGDRERQARLRGIGERMARRVIARFGDAPPDLWFTYHVHHKAPDLLGPAATRALDIPYVVAEASTAPKQRGGRWADGHADALAAIRAADTIVFLNPADVPEVRRARGAEAPFDMLAPFIDVAAFMGNARTPRRDRPSDAVPRLATVAMMRDGAKLASYRTLATALERLRDAHWELAIVGDGPARAAVEDAFAPLAARVRFLGARSAAGVAALLRQSDVFVWPAVDEAIGIVFLEAQACGVPVVGANLPGVAAVVAAEHSGLLAPPGDADAFAAATRRLIVDPLLRGRMARNAFGHVRLRHDLPLAAARLDAILRRVVAGHRVPT
jgi:glycosyltransferase involved in cell wall biosynthesis